MSHGALKFYDWRFDSISDCYLLLAHTFVRNFDRGVPLKLMEALLGAIALLNLPERPAVDVLSEFYGLQASLTGHTNSRFNCIAKKKMTLDFKNHPLGLAISEAVYRAPRYTIGAIQ